LYLSLGYSKIDAICVFNKVFLTADTKQNDLRSRKINEYIDRFEREEFAKRIN
jgi:actin-related protein